ncbi:hypothetical protein BV25DRAFT_1993068 [Artomyces pyxidatus]|uniref:Uncharacterized protein n=1 Tax=Artomyces pyxidatus TaxID=48021 RepID=A0ACB8SVS0_9AGAM|nr:hypothetical protein BV25DRAFT_1993068 [Artomyces pyxidatus]
MLTFTSPEERHYMSPSSSPDGSPYSQPMDSSPLSSPTLEPLELDDSVSGPVHPYAGSTKATRRPTLYEKRSSVRAPRQESTSWIASHPSVVKFKTDLLDDLFEEGAASAERKAPVLAEDPWERWWDETVATAVDTGLSVLDVSSGGIPFISSRIAELDGLGVVQVAQAPTPRAFGRSRTEPASQRFSNVSWPNAPFSPVDRPVGYSGQERGLQFFFANNEIAKLPLELFTLRNITVLSLRNNKLMHVPPEIAELRALRSLNISNNRLEYLPAEMLSLSLNMLDIHPNSFMKDPAGPMVSIADPILGSNTSCSVSATRSQPFRLPSLQELTLRILLSPAPPPSSSPDTTSNAQNPPAQPVSKTILEKYYAFPLPERSVPPWSVDLLRRKFPGSVARQNNFSRAASSATLPPAHRETTPQNHDMPQRVADPLPTSVSRCPAPSHRVDARGTSGPHEWVRVGPPFVQHAEERFLWATVIAGVKVGQANGGVPLLWRGCEHGCLDFLSRDAVVSGGAEGVEQAGPEAATVEDTAMGE